MTPPSRFINPPRPSAPYRIPATKETTRTAGQWKALSGLAKVGIVTGAVLSLGMVEAFANPLTSAPNSQVPKLANVSATASTPTASAPAPSKVATPEPASATVSTPATATVPAATTAAPTVESTAPATTAAPATKAPTTAKTTTAVKTTTAAKTTSAAVSGAVTAGAFCSPAGKTGVTSTGKPMVCKTSATDTRLRWRAA